MPAARAFRHGLLGDDPVLDQGLERRWRAIVRAFPDGALADWLAACRTLRLGVAGRAGALAYIASAADCAEIVGAEAAIGANAVVTKDAPADSVLVGVPAKPRQRREGEDTRSILTTPEYPEYHI